MILLCFLILFPDELPVAEDTLTHDSTQVIRYQAKKIIYDIDNSIVILYDSSTITYGDIKLVSDSAYYHIDKKELEAFGSCDLRQLTDSIKGEYLRYNIENKKALMLTGKTQIDKGYLIGRDIRWIDAQTINAYHGIYTTCSHSPPHYYFYAPKMKVYLGDMVIARPIVLFVEGIPVIAAPFWFVPISSKRKSGLLPFRAGNSRNYGKYIRGFAYYLVVSDYADVTFQLDAMEKKGVMPHVEGVWDFTPYSKGMVYGSYIRETTTETQRYNIEARNSSQNFLLGTSFNCDIKYVSDNSYRQDYTDTTELWVEQEIVSQATLNRTIGGYKNTFIFERKEDFIQNSITEKFPYYSLTSPSHTLFSLLSYSLSGHISRNTFSVPDSSRDVAGAHVNTAPTMQQSLFQLLTISPRLELDYAVFDEDTTGQALPTRFGYSFGISASTNFYRVFGVDLLGIHGVLHKVLPKVSYTYTPEQNTGHLPIVAGIPRFSKANAIGLGLDQVFEAKIGADEEKRILSQLGIATTYNLLTDSLSQITYSLELPYNPFPRPITTFTSQLRGSLNPYTQEYAYTISNTSALTTSFFTVTINQQYAKDGIYQVWFGGEVKPTPHWALSYSARYDWDQKEFVNYSFGLRRDLHCWEAVFNFNQLGDDWRYDFQIRIRDIPEVTIGKGLLGYILE